MALAGDIPMEEVNPTAGATLLGSLELAVERWDAVTKHIPPSVIRECKGICFLHEGRVGFAVVSAIGSNGFILAKLPLQGATPTQTWSGPVAVYGGGLGVGPELGGSECFKLLVFSDMSSLYKFGNAKFDIGLSASIAAGPIGREVDATAHVTGLRSATTTFSYAIAEGVLMGASLDATRLCVSTQLNKEFYGKEVDPPDVLEGREGVGLADKVPVLKSLYEGLAIAAGDVGSLKYAEAVEDLKKSL
eukprot:jgi/Mesvir1/13305/Mv08595-RA.1